MEPIASVSDIPPGTCKTFEVDGVEVAVFNVEGAFYALDNECPHEGGPLAEGKVRGDKVFCPWHMWAIDVKTGVPDSFPDYRARRHAVRVESDHIFVELTDGDADSRRA